MNEGNIPDGPILNRLILPEDCVLENFVRLELSERISSTGTCSSLDPERVSLTTLRGSDAEVSPDLISREFGHEVTRIAMKLTKEPYFQNFIKTDLHVSFILSSHDEGEDQVAELVRREIRKELRKKKWGEATIPNGRNTKWGGLSSASSSTSAPIISTELTLVNDHFAQKICVELGQKLEERWERTLAGKEDQERSLWNLHAEKHTNIKSTARPNVESLVMAWYDGPVSPTRDGHGCGEETEFEPQVEGRDKHLDTQQVDPEEQDDDGLHTDAWGWGLHMDAYTNAEARKDSEGGKNIQRLPMDKFTNGKVKQGIKDRVKKCILQAAQAPVQRV